MRLLLLATHYWERGGIEAYVRTLEQASRSLNARLDVLTVSGGWIPATKKGDANGGVEATRLGWSKKAAFLNHIVIAGLTRKYDAVLCAHPYLSPLPWMWRKAGGPPYVVFAYGMEVWDGLAGNRRRGLVGADRVATISTYTAKRLVTGCAVNEGRIRMLPPCVPDAYLTPLTADAAREKARQHWGLNGCKVILTVGRQALSESYKGADLLIRAMPAISRAVGNVACMVAGGGDGHAALKKVAQEVDVGESVRILGAVSASELMSLYDACDVFVLPSKGEGFGIVLLEAAARGRPSVSLRFGGIEDAVLGGRTGLLVDTDDPADLALAVTRVLEGDVPEHFNDPRELRRIVVDNFGFDRFTYRLAGILEEIVPYVRSANE